jgi:hypothetical protein
MEINEMKPQPGDIEYRPGFYYRPSKISYFYTLVPMGLAIIGFFMLPLPWYLALPAAFGINFVGMIPLMIKFSREDRRLGL